MRGEAIYKILDSIEDVSLSMADFTLVFLKAGYGASMSKIEYEDRLLNNKRIGYRVERANKRHLQIYLSKLKSDGLLTENSLNEIKLSRKGKRKLKLFRKRQIIDPKSYIKKSGDRVIIISYDIPTAFNRERDILRSILVALGLHMVHKSVWIGKVKIPKEFISALSMMNILKFVEILEVTKKGSIKEF